MPPGMIQESCRPRVSDRTMVGNSATRLACEFQRTEWRRHVSEHETTGTKKHPRPVAPRPRGPLRSGTKRSSRCRTNVATGAGGWMSKKYSCRSGREKCFLLDIPFNRTSRSCGLVPDRRRLEKWTIGLLHEGHCSLLVWDPTQSIGIRLRPTCPWRCHYTVEVLAPRE